MKKLAILGAGGHGLVVAEAARMMGWSHITFFDDSFKKIPSKYCIGGSITDFLKVVNKFGGIHVAIGDNAAREKILKSLYGQNIVTIVHPSALISSDVKIGVGTSVLAGTIVSKNACLGNGVILNTGSIVDHDSYVGDFSHIAPGVSVAGNVKIGKKCLIGIGTSITNGVSIGSGTIIGVGSAVISDVPANCMSCGVPSKITHFYMP